jgi:hypothetical protein
MIFRKRLETVIVPKYDRQHQHSDHPSRPSHPYGHTTPTGLTIRLSGSNVRSVVEGENSLRLSYAAQALRFPFSRLWFPGHQPHLSDGLVSPAWLRHRYVVGTCGRSSSHRLILLAGFPQLRPTFGIVVPQHWRRFPGPGRSGAALSVRAIRAPRTLAHCRPRTSS